MEETDFDVAYVPYQNVTNAAAWTLTLKRFSLFFPTTTLEPSTSTPFPVTYSRSQFPHPNPKRQFRDSQS